MKRLFWFIGLICALSALLPTTVYASVWGGIGGYNEYRGKRYKTLEEVDALQEVVKADGYYLVEADSELAAMLKDDKEFEYRWDILSPYCLLYVHPQDVKDYLAGDIEMLNDNAVLVSYTYWHKDSEENPAGWVDDEIPEDCDVFYITFTFESQYYNPISIVLHETNRDEYTLIELTEWDKSDDGWYTLHRRVKLPAGRFELISVKQLGGNLYPLGWYGGHNMDSMYGECSFTVDRDMNGVLDTPFIGDGYIVSAVEQAKRIAEIEAAQAEREKTETEKSTAEAETKTSTVTEQSTDSKGTYAPKPLVQTVTSNTAQEKDKDNGMSPAVVIVPCVAIAGVLGFLFVKKKRKRTEF